MWMLKLQGHLGIAGIAMKIRRFFCFSLVNVVKMDQSMLGGTGVDPQIWVGMRKIT